MLMSIRLEGAAPLLTVYDVPTAVAFYRDLLGFEVIQTSKPFTSAKDDYGWAMLRLDGVEVMLNNAYENNIRPAAPDLARIAAHRDVCLYCGCRDVDAAYEYLTAKGASVSRPEVTYYGMRQIHLHDPDGYGICFQWPEDRS